MNKKIKLALIISLIFPLVVFAENVTALSLLKSINRVIDTLIPIAASLALLAFFWGLAKFIFQANNEDKIADGRRIMVWGIVALFVMVSVWGLTGFLQNALGIR